MQVAVVQVPAPPARYQALVELAVLLVFLVYQELP
jgi:hypothetical protein